jgi:hypothetical protein
MHLTDLSALFLLLPPDCTCCPAEQTIQQDINNGLIHMVACDADKQCPNAGERSKIMHESCPQPQKDACHPVGWLNELPL